ncbi:MAG: beta-propeller domain-containing protein [Nanoarchaeota archaeon]
MNNKFMWGIAGIALIAIIILAGVTTQNDSIKQFSSTSQLESFLEANTDEAYGALNEQSTTTLESGSSDGKSTPASAPANTGRYSTTNVQVTDVDEPDFVKNDGEYIYIARDNKLLIVQATPAENMKTLAEIPLEGFVNNIFVNGDTLIVFGMKYTEYALGYKERPLIAEEESKIASTMPVPFTSESFVYIYTIQDRANPQIEKELVYDGNYQDARMTNGYVYVITNQPLLQDSNDELLMPAVRYNGLESTIEATDIAYFPVPDYGYQLTTIFVLELDDLAREPVRESFLTGYTQTLYMSSSALYLTAPKYVPYDTYDQRMMDEVIVASLTGEARDEAESIANSNRPTYEKNELIQDIIATTYNTLSDDEKAAFQKTIAERLQAFQQDWRAEMQKTVIHKITIDADRVTYAGKGEVPGHVLSQFSMDEHKSYLRVATTTDNWFGGWGGPITIAMRGTAAGSDEGAPVSVETPDKSNTPDGTNDQAIEPVPVPEPDTTWIPEMIVEQETTNNVYVLDDDLNLVGSLENLAEGERIYSARFIGDRVYLVTFKQVDPLFVIDLSEPSNPKVLGELKIPGYSTYLHPFDENTLIGIGQDSSGEVDEGGFQAAIPAGVKIGLFDVSDSENPREIDSYVIGDRGSYSDALYDHKAFLFDNEKGLLVLPINVQERSPAKAQGIPEEQFWYPTTTTFMGAYVFKLSQENGIERLGTITHLTASEQLKMEQAKTSTDYYYPPYEAQISRSLYIGTTWYTISQRSVQANALETLQEIASVSLPVQSYVYSYAEDGSREESAGSPPPELTSS